MATTIYFRDTPAGIHRGTNTAKLNTNASGWFAKALSTSRGAGAINRGVVSVAGATNGIEAEDSNLPIEWISEPLNQDITISGTITFNLRGLELSMNANAAINAIIERLDSQGAIVSTIVQTARVTELGTTEAAANFTATPTSTNMLKGDRFRIRVYFDDAGTMAAGFGLQFWFDGPTAAASGDSFVTFTETFGFITAVPGGSQLFLTDVAGPSLGGVALRSDFTGADETPLSEGGNWAAINTGGSMQRVSNHVAAQSAGAKGSYWTPTTFGPDVEVYTTLGAPFTGTNRIFARLQDVGGSNTADGYAASVSETAQETQIQRITNFGINAVLASRTGSALWNNGDKLGLSCEGSIIRLWRFPSGGSAWILILEVQDSTYPNAGYVGIGADATTCNLDDFHAGNAAGTFELTKEMWTSRGNGANSIVRNSVAGWTIPLQWTDSAGGSAVEWYSRPVQEFTLSGLVTIHLRGTESNLDANISYWAELAVCDVDGGNPVIWAAGHPNDAIGGELGTTEGTMNWVLCGSDTVVTNAQRLRFRAFIDDTQLAMLASRTATLFYDGTTVNATGDSWIQLTQTVEEQPIDVNPTYTALRAGTGMSRVR